MLSSCREKNVITLFEAVMLVGRTGCTLYIPYSIHRFSSNTHPCEEPDVALAPRLSRIRTLNTDSRGNSYGVQERKKKKKRNAGEIKYCTDERGRTVTG